MDHSRLFAASSTAINPIRYRTSLCSSCSSTTEGGKHSGDNSCPYDLRCMFAHRPEDLRTEEMNVRDGLTTMEAIYQHYLYLCEERRRKLKNQKKSLKQRERKKRQKQEEQQESLPLSQREDTEITTDLSTTTGHLVMELSSPQTVATPAYPCHGDTADLLPPSRAIPFKGHRKTLSTATVNSVWSTEEECGVTPVAYGSPLAMSFNDFPSEPTTSTHSATNAVWPQHSPTAKDQDRGYYRHDPYKVACFA